MAPQTSPRERMKEPKSPLGFGDLRAGGVVGVWFTGKD